MKPADVSQTSPHQTCRRPRQTCRDFEEAFLKLYAKQPINEITIAQLCQVAGYNRGTFYLHWHDIYELLEEVQDAYLEGMTNCVKNCFERMDANASKAVRAAALKDVVFYYETNRQAIEILLGTRADPVFLLRLKTALKPLWKHHVVNARSEHSEAEIDLILEYTLTGVLFMISCWLQNPDGISKLRMGHLIYDIAIRDVEARVAH